MPLEPDVDNGGEVNGGSLCGSGKQKLPPAVGTIGKRCNIDSSPRPSTPLSQLPHAHNDVEGVPDGACCPVCVCAWDVLDVVKGSWCLGEDNRAGKLREELDWFILCVPIPGRRFRALCVDISRSRPLAFVGVPDDRGEGDMEVLVGPAEPLPPIMELTDILSTAAKVARGDGRAPDARYPRPDVSVRAEDVLSAVEVARWLGFIAVFWLGNHW